jgi:hypothetical protein
MDLVISFVVVLLKALGVKFPVEKRPKMGRPFLYESKFINKRVREK